MGSEQGSCDPHLIKTNWFDKRHRLNVYKEICILILNSNISHFKMVMVPFHDNMRVFQHTKRCKIWIRTANSMSYFLYQRLQTIYDLKQSRTGQMQLLFSKEQQNLSFGALSKHTALISLLKMKHLSGGGDDCATSQHFS